MAKKKIRSHSITNRRARYDYELGDSWIVGIVLNGRETKALRLGHGQLKGAYVTVKDNELYLINATISGTSGASIDEHEQTQARKLLAKKNEISKLIQAKEQGNTIIPLDILKEGRYIKLRIAIGKGKKRYDKRQTIKTRETERQMKRILLSSRP